MENSVEDYRVLYDNASTNIRQGQLVSAGLEHTNIDFSVSKLNLISEQ
jgi:hypothetical protein